MKTRRERGDFIQIYKLFQRLQKVNWCADNNILRPNLKADRRRHPFQWCRELTRNYEWITHFLLNRMITSWNNLLKNIEHAASVNSYKNRFDFYLKRAGRITSIYSKSTAIDETGDIIPWYKSLQSIFSTSQLIVLNKFFFKYRDRSQKLTNVRFRRFKLQSCRK